MTCSKKAELFTGWQLDIDIFIYSYSYLVRSEINAIRIRLGKSASEKEWNTVKMTILSMNLLVATAIMALISELVFATEPKPTEKNWGNLDVQLRTLHVVSGRNNGYDPNTGTAYLVKLKYDTPSWNASSLGVGFYNAGDLFDLTDFNNPNKKVARGLFVEDDGDEKSLMGEAYLRHTRPKINIHGGREHYSTPLTQILASTIPNLYTVVGGSTTVVSGTEFSASQIVQMSFGARAMTDFGLIGEGTGTAGATIVPNSVGQAEFHRIGKISLGQNAQNKGTNGITVLGVEYSGLRRVAGFKTIDMSMWNYYSDDISNNLYLQANANYPLKNFKLKLGAQYLYQTDVGRSRLGNLKFHLFGIKATLAGKGWAIYGAYNHSSSGDGNGFSNSYGSDPGYTSTIFSRNEYRKDVDAYLVGFKYRNLSEKLLMPFTLIVNYANYGESDSIGRVSSVGTGLSSQDDADELDLIFAYNPPQISALTLKMLTAWRSSEYDGSNGFQLKQRHARIIADLKF